MGYDYRDGISLSKTIGFSEPECYNYLEIDRNTSKLVLYTLENYTDNWHHRLYGHKAYEAFISGDFMNYLINENIYYDDDDDDDDNDHFGVYDF